MKNSSRVSRVSTDELQEIVKGPPSPDFRFAYAELNRRGLNLSDVQEVTLATLLSVDIRERQDALIRLQFMYPACFDALNAIGAEENSPSELRANVQAILERNGKKKLKRQ